MNKILLSSLLQTRSIMYNDASVTIKVIHSTKIMFLWLLKFCNFKHGKKMKLTGKLSNVFNYYLCLSSCPFSS